MVRTLSRSMLLRSLLLLGCGALLLAPVSALLAWLFSVWLVPTEAVIAASFFGPLLLLLLLLPALWPRFWRGFVLYLLICLLCTLPWWLR